MFFNRPTDAPVAIEGYNGDAPGGKHKMSFVPQVLQFHVPAGMLQDPDKLESLAAKMAARVALTAMGMIAHRKEKDVAEVVRATGLWFGPYIGLLEETHADLMALSDDILKKVAANPKGAAVQTLKAAQDIRNMSLDKEFQDGPRAALKLAAKAGDPEAEAVFLARAHARLADPHYLAVAYTQGVKGALLPPAQRDAFKALAPKAKAIVQAAAVLGDAFHADRMAGALGLGPVSGGDAVAPGRGIHEGRQVGEPAGRRLREARGGCVIPADVGRPAP